MKYIKNFKIFESISADKMEVLNKILPYIVVNNNTTYNVNDDLSIDIHGSVQFKTHYKERDYIRKVKFDKLPVKFNKIYGDFYASDIGINTLEGFPEYIDGDLHIDQNNLYDLKYLPKVITGKIYCNDNPNLYSLEGCDNIKSIQKMYRTPFATLLSTLTDKLPGFNLYDLIYRLEEFGVLDGNKINLYSLRSMIDFQYANGPKIQSVESLLKILDYNIDDIESLGLFGTYKLVR